MFSFMRKLYFVEEIMPCLEEEIAVFSHEEEITHILEMTMFMRAGFLCMRILLSGWFRSC